MDAYLLSLWGMFLANAALICWFRSESRSDWRHMDNQVKAIQDEMKDFHGRLIEIETKKKIRGE